MRQHPAIKVAHARAAGETWEDTLEYHISVSMLLMWLSPLISTQFNADHGETDFVFRLGCTRPPGGIAFGGEGVGQIPTGP